MSIAFDTRSLNAAAALVMNIAAQKNIQSTKVVESDLRKNYSLQDIDQVIEFLMDKTEAIYKEANPVVVASIAGVPYYSIGVVFDLMPNEIHPEPPIRGQGKPTHLACFWQAL